MCVGGVHVACLVVCISCVRDASRVCVCRQVHILVSSDAHFRRPDDHFLHRPGGGVPPVCLVVCVSCVWVGRQVHILVVRMAIFSTFLAKKVVIFSSF